jgi:hypothetical protein
MNRPGKVDAHEGAATCEEVVESHKLVLCCEDIFRGREEDDGSELRKILWSKELRIFGEQWRECPVLLSKVSEGLNASGDARGQDLKENERKKERERDRPVMSKAHCCRVNKNLGKSDDGAESRHAGKAKREDVHDEQRNERQMGRADTRRLGSRRTGKDGRGSFELGNESIAGSLLAAGTT